MDRERLARLARQRRLTLDLDIDDVAERAGLHRNTVGNIEGGGSVKLRTLWKLDRGLGWEPGSAERVLAGGDPVELGQPGIAEQIADLEQEIATASGTPAQRERWAAELAELRRRYVADRQRDAG